MASCSAFANASLRVAPRFLHHPLKYSRHTSSRCVVSTRAYKARWLLDVRFGQKAKATDLLLQWVRDVGSQAGLSSSNTSILSGAVGAPESRLVLEIEMADFAALEFFWSSIPSKQHASWSSSIRDLVVDGSPTWEVYRTVPLQASTSGQLTIVDTVDEAERILAGGDGIEFATANQPLDGDVASLFPGQELRTTESGLAVVENIREAKLQQKRQQIDWKGDPMTINPGDKLPRFQ